MPAMAINCIISCNCSSVISPLDSHCLHCFMSAAISCSRILTTVCSDFSASFRDLEDWEAVFLGTERSNNHAATCACASTEPSLAASRQISMASPSSPFLYLSRACSSLALATFSVSFACAMLNRQPNVINAIAYIFILFSWFYFS